MAEGLTPRGQSFYHRTHYEITSPTRTSASLLRQLANPNLHDIPCNLPFRVEMWDRSDQHVRWMMAASASVAIGHAAMDAAIANYPDSGSRCGMGYWSFDSIREFSGLF